MDAATIEIIINAISGPASAVAVSLLCMSGFGYFLVKHMLPAQQKIMDSFIVESRANRKVFVDAVEVMSRRLERVEDDINDIKQVIVRRGRSSNNDQ
jgi:hypothetical protein